MDVLSRHNVQVSGNPDRPPMLFAHGFGCDQNVWRHVAPAFAEDYRLVLFDFVGAGQADPAAYDVQRHGQLQGYAEDLLEICRALDLQDVVLVGHSVAAMIAVLAAAEEPTRFSRLVLLGPSARYVDDPPYVGGFSQADIDDMLESLASNYLGWSTAMAPAIMGADHPVEAAELTESFCRTDPDLARRFARVTFGSDNRADLARVPTPSLVLQCSDDVLAAPDVGHYVADHLPSARFVQMAATGHCPHLSAPEETIAAMQDFLCGAPVRGSS